MASSALSAQGSTFKIGTGAGGAKTISGVVVGYPTIITATAHGLPNGNVGSLAGLTGADAALLNGQSVVIKNVTTNTFAIDIDTTGKTITAGAGAVTPVAYTKISNLKTFSGFDGSASEIDVTNMDSTAKEFRLGLVDPGQFQMDFDQDQSDAGQTALRAAQVAGTIQNFILTLPNGRTASFTGFVKKFSSQGGVDAVVKAQANIRISGAVTWA